MNLVIIISIISIISIAALVVACIAFSRTFKSKEYFNKEPSTLLFYTSHRQDKEIELSAKLLKRTKKLKTLDLLYYCNKIDLDVKPYFDLLPNQNKKLIHTSKNAGYQMGRMESLTDTYDIWKNYDYVIYTQPDIYVINEDKILDVLDKYRNRKEIFIFTKSLADDEKFYSADIWIFKPKLVPLNIIELWKTDATFGNLSKTPNIEYLLHKIMTENNIPHIMIKRFDNDHWNPRRIDLLGLWHEHETSKVEKYLKELG